MMERYSGQWPAIYSALQDNVLKVSVKNIAILNDSEQKLSEELIQVLKLQKILTSLMISETRHIILTILSLKRLLSNPWLQEFRTVQQSEKSKQQLQNKLARSYTDPKHHDYLQPWTPGLKPAIL